MSVKTHPFQVENHKTASSMGPAPILLSAQDLTTLRNFIHQCRSQISPMAITVHEVFTTSSGARITPSHMNKIILSGLGGPASRIRKALAGHVSNSIIVHISHNFLPLHFYFTVH